jgi:O-antigen/teichoic acid export membrane protein
MDRRAARARIRQGWEEEVREDEEQERQIKRQLRKWVLATALLGIALTATCGGLVPFLAGHSLHQHWDAIGKKVLLLAMALYFFGSEQESE